MSDSEKRRKARYDSDHLTNIVLQENGKEIGQTFGKALNSSETGMLLETPREIAPPQMVTVTIAVEEDLFDFKAQVKRCKTIDKTCYHVGIRFLDLDPERMRVINNYIRIFNQTHPDASTENGSKTDIS